MAVCVRGWERGVGEVVVFSIGTLLLTAATHRPDTENKSGSSTFTVLAKERQGAENKLVEVLLHVIFDSESPG